MEREELIDKFIEGTLTQGEKTKFDNLHKNDTSFRQEVLFIKDLKASAGKEDRDQLRQKLNDFEAEIASRETKVIPLLKYKKWIAAACILLAVTITGITVYNNPTTIDTSQLYAENFEPYKNVVTPIVRSDVDQNEETTAFTNYENKKYELAISQFDQLFNKTKTPYFLLYQSNALLALHKSKEAIPLLEKHIELNDKLSERSKWYLALAYLKENRKEEAIFLLKGIVRKGIFKKSAALQLLEKLN